MANKVSVTLYTVPQAACDSSKMNWTEAGQMLHQQLVGRLGDQLNFGHIEFMSDQWFEDVHAQGLMEAEGLSLPFVLVDGKLASSGDKINISRVVRQAQALLNATL
jgi:hypothetical protein